MRSLSLLLVAATGAAACQQSRDSTEPEATGSPAEQVGRPGSQPAAPGPAAGSDIPPAFPAIEGEIVLGEGLGADAVTETDVIFVMARTEDGDLVATELIEDARPPAAFHLDRRDIMVHGEGTHPPYRLSARLDRDQDAMTRGDDDLYALHEAPLQGGETGIRLVLKRKPDDALHGGGAASQPASK